MWQSDRLFSEELLRSYKQQQNHSNVRKLVSVQ